MTLTLNHATGVALKTYDVMVDIDDVVAPWFDTVIGACTRLWGEPETPCTSWEMWKHWPGKDRTLWGDAVISATQVDGLYTTVDPIPGSVEAINGLLFMGHRVHIVTARGFMEGGDNIRRWTPEWLDNFGIGRTSLTFSKDKVGAQRELGVDFDFAIDDGVHNFDALHSAGVNVWLQDALHNQHHPTNRRVHSLWEFAKMIHLEAARAA